MPEHKMVEAGRWIAVIEPADFAVRAADAHFQGAKLDLGRQRRDLPARGGRSIPRRASCDSQPRLSSGRAVCRAGQDLISIAQNLNIASSARKTIDRTSSSDREN